MTDRLPAPRVQTAGRGTLALMTTATFAFFSGPTMLGPLLVDMARELDISLGQAGLLAAAMALPWALSAPLSGLLSDRLGRRPLIVLALVGVGATTLGAALAPNFAVLLGLRFLGGLLGAGGPASLMASVGDLFPPSRRGMAMGWLNLGATLTAVVGVPLIGVVGGLFGWRWAFASTGLALLGVAALMHLAFPATRGAGEPGGVLATYRVVLGVPVLGNVLAANLLERTVFHATTLYLPPFLMLSYGLGASEIAPALALVAGGALAGNVLGGWLGDRLPKPAVFVLAQLGAGAIGLALFGLAVGLLVSTLVGALFALVNSTSRPAFLALTTELSSQHRGAVLGLLSLTNQGGVVVGSTLGGLVISLAGYPALAAVVPVGVVLAATCIMPLMRHRYARPAQESPADRGR